MPSFCEFFMKSKAPPIEWSGKTLVMWDKFSVKNGGILLISIEKTNSDYLQGLCVDVTGFCKVNRHLHKTGSSG